MKKIIKLHWNNYKNSDSGKDVIAAFDKLTNPNTTVEELYELACRFDPECFKNTSSKEKKQELEALGRIESDVQWIWEEINKLNQDGAYIDYKALSCILLNENVDEEFDSIPQATFKSALGGNMMLSLMLSRYFPNYYIPNFFPMQFIYLKKIAEKYEIELPGIPNRSDYRSRWLYYDEMCKALNQFAEENELDSLSELCAFLYGYEMEVIKEEMEEEHNKTIPEVPEQAWILVGNYGEGEKSMNEGYWQSSPFTRKGDIMVFYEKSPVRKLNSVWIALEDGVIEPFGHYYSYSYIGHKIEIPDEKAISYADFKTSDYFKNRDKKGNFVSKNFQDVSGWEVTYDDYAEIKRILKEKGFDISILPSLYQPKRILNVTIKDEKDVENYLLKPLLKDMGWKFKVDYDQQVEFPAGHGTTGHRMDKRPDFILHYRRYGKQIITKVVIEVKYHMKNSKEIKETFDQGVSYANWGKAQTLVLCDENQILIYQLNSEGVFNFDKCTRTFHWEDLENHDSFMELKRLIS